MLLSLMRKHAKSWLIKFLIGMIAVVFIFYFGYSFKSRTGIKVAYVNGELISGVEYQKAYRNLLQALQRDYKNVWSDNLIKVFDLKNRALESVINEKLLSQEAKRVGLNVTDEEIQNQILAYPAFQFRGRFDPSRYRSLLQQNRMNPEDFEAGIAQDLLQKKLNQFLMTFIAVTDQEILDYYTFLNRQVKLSYVTFSPESYEASVQVDESALKTYFEAQKETYRIPEKIRIAYVTVDPEAFREQAQVSDLEIDAYYEDNMELFEQKKEVKARHILFKVEEGVSEEEEEKIRGKAVIVAKQARDGEDFAKLAETYSQGPTAKEGGDLGYFSKGNMVKPFEEAAFNMAVGEISDPVRSPFGFHIIKVEDIKEARVKPLDEVRPEIRETLIKTTSMDLAHAKALSLMDQMPYDADLKGYAESQNMEIKETPFFSQEEDIPGMGGDTKLRQTLFSLQEKAVSDLIEYDNRFFIIQVMEKKASDLPELKEVEAEVREDFFAHLCLQEAKSAAEAYLSQLKDGEDWADLAKRNDLKIETTDFFSRGGRPVPPVGDSLDLLEAAFHLSQDGPYPDLVYEGGDGILVIRWEGEKGIDQEQFRKDKEQIRIVLMKSRHQGFFSNWLASLKERAEIELINPPEKT